jgi:D-amino-acid dehydrogenase
MSERAAAQKSVIVVGAGIVGICCALYLQREGFRVTLIDRNQPGEGTSYGNAGIIALGSVIPVGTPGILKKVPAMLMDPLAPLSLRWSYLPQLTPWLIRLLRASTPERVEEISKALVTITKPALAHYEPLLTEANARELIGRLGSLYVFTTTAELEAAEPDIELRLRRGIELELLSAPELRQMQPALRPDVAGAIFVPGAAHCVNPLALSQALAHSFVAQGGRLLQERVLGLRLGQHGVTHVVTDAMRYPTDAAVIAAGAFSRGLVQDLGTDLPLDTERGYHVQLPEPGIEVRLPMLFPGRGFAVTPMATGLRCAGTVELGGLNAAPNYARADILLQQAKELLPGLKDRGAERWMGHRPSMPDSLPVISVAPGQRNVFFAFGHGHLGLTLGAVTGRLIADLCAGRPPSIDLTPFRADRF